MANRYLRAILSSRGFRRLLGIRLSSQFGDGLFSGGLAGSILFNPGQQARPLAIATGFAILLLPYSLLGPYVGVFLDRWSRRNVLVYANLLRAGLVLPAAALIFTGHQDLIFILCSLLVIGINRFILAGHSAAIPHVVAARHLVTANALAPTLGTVCNSLGLGVSALVQLTLFKGGHGYGVIAAGAVLGYVLSSLLAHRSFARPDLGPDGTGQHPRGVLAEIVDVTRGMVAGGRHLWQRPGSAYLLGAQSGYRVLYGVLAVAALLLYRNYFNTDQNFSHSILGLAQVVVSGGAGSFLAAVITPGATRRFGGRTWVTMLLCGAGLLVVALGWPFREPLLVAAVFAINVAAQGTKIVVDTSLQRECADEYRGRVFSVNDTTYNVCFVAGLYLGALALPPDGHSLPAVLLVGLGYLLVGAGYGLAARRLTHRPAPVPVAELRGNEGSR